MLARFSGGRRRLTEQTVERGRLLVFASDLDNRWNRFPLNPAFVPWAIETLRYLTQGREQRQNLDAAGRPGGDAGRAWHIQSGRRPGNAEVRPARRYQC